MAKARSQRHRSSRLPSVSTLHTDPLAAGDEGDQYRQPVAALNPIAASQAEAAASNSAAPSHAAPSQATAPVSPSTGAGAARPGAPGSAGDVSDVELVARMVRGDRLAVALLYQRHQGPLFGLARSMLRSSAEAEDLLHDVFLEAWRHSADYSAERGTVRAWLILRTRSRALDRLQSAARTRTAVALDPPPAEAAPAELVDQTRLRQLLAQMPHAQQQVLLLGYFEGLSSADISERLAIPIGTVKSRTRAALETLRGVLGKGHV